MAVDSLWSSVTLLLPCSTDLLDVKGHGVTVVGNTALSSAVGTPFGSGNSCYFDGTGDYLTVPTGTDFAFGSGDFTIEAWIRRSISMSSGTYRIVNEWNGSTGYILAVVNNNIYFSCNNGTSYSVTGGATSLNTWHFVTARRSGSSIYVSIDGTETSSSVSGSIPTPVGTTYIGRASDGDSQLFTGYFADIRITKGVARSVAVPTGYFPRPKISGVVLNSSAAPDEKTVIVRDRNTQLYLGGANSDPSTGAYVFYPPDFGEVQVERVDALFDPDFHLVRLLCPFTSSLADSVGNAVTANNGAALSSAVGNPFGAGNALFLDGTDDYLSIPGASFSFTKVTIEAWIRPSALTGYRPFYAGENSRLAFYLSGTTLELGIWGVSGIVTKTSAITVANVWRHVAAVLDGGMASLFVDGSKVASAGYSSSIVAPSTLKIGKSDGTDYFAGYIGPIRVTAAARKITAAPSGPFLFSPTDGGSGENALIYDRVIPG